ncbi:YopX protein [compost metagenome]
MREIKFRGKRIDNGEWVVGWLLTNKLGTYIITEKNPHECTQYGYITIEQYHRVDPETVGQCINKKDTTGKEIYEGDYDIENGVYYIAQYQDGELGMITHEPGFDPDFDTCVNWHNFTVRGNRWDNPDLLGG